MSNASEIASELKKKNAGLAPGIIACVLAILGMFTLGFLFIPLAAIVALIGTIIAVKNKCMSGIGVSILAWVLTIVGLMMSPVLLAVIGLASS